MFALVYPKPDHVPASLREPQRSARDARAP